MQHHDDWNSASARRSTDVVWITWEIQRRNRTLSRAIGAELIEIDLHLPRLLRYPLSIWQTFRQIRSRCPKVVVCQSPSLVLASFLVLYRAFSKIQVVIDAHNSGIFPAEGKSRLLNTYAAWTLRSADATIVSNRRLADYIAARGAIPVVTPDPIPDLPRPQRLEEQGRASILFVCTWASDEPCEEIAHAARILLEDGVVIYATGRKDRADLRLRERPDNLILTGFLPEEEYVRLLFSVDAVLVLTTRDDCLTCGAYEAVAAEKPLILSDTTALRSFFRRGTRFCNNSAGSLAAAIRDTLANLRSLRQEMKAFRLQLSAEIEAQISDLRRTIRDLVDRR